MMMKLIKQWQLSLECKPSLHTLWYLGRLCQAKVITAILCQQKWKRWDAKKCFQDHPHPREPGLEPWSAQLHTNGTHQQAPLHARVA